MKERMLALTLPGGPTLAPPPGVPDGGSAGGILNWVVITLSVVAVLATLFFLLWGAFKWITSGGDKDKVDNARRTVVFSIIGLVIVILAIVLINFISSLLLGK